MGEDVKMSSKFDKKENFAKTPGENMNFANVLNELRNEFRLVLKTVRPSPARDFDLVYLVYIVKYNVFLFIYISFDGPHFVKHVCITNNGRWLNLSMLCLKMPNQSCWEWKYTRGSNQSKISGCIILKNYQQHGKC